MKKFALAAAAIALTSSPAFAGGVVGWTATDGFSAVPIAKGTTILDSRLYMEVDKNLNTIAVPTVHLLEGAGEGVELGIGAQTANAFGAAGLSQLSSLYPWLRASIPAISSDAIKFGYMAGVFMLNAADGKSQTLTPGLSLLADIPTGGSTLGINLGYKRDYAQGVEWGTAGSQYASLNFNETWSAGGFNFYSEVFTDYNVSNSDFAVSGARLTVGFPINDKFAVDVNPAVLFRGGQTIFQPNFGFAITW
ncbi:MAG: hypothetical protein VKP72_08005 [bacterium]|nr:hypothetical protein [bacterium]